jgi:hypothetical protein
MEDGQFLEQICAGALAVLSAGFVMLAHKRANDANEEINKIRQSYVIISGDRVEDVTEVQDSVHIGYCNSRLHKQTI